MVSRSNSGSIVAVLERHTVVETKGCMFLAQNVHGPLQGYKSNPVLARGKELQHLGASPSVQSPAFPTFCLDQTTSSSVNIARGSLCSPYLFPSHGFHLHLQLHSSLLQ